jgi:hypothetical protein
MCSRNNTRFALQYMVKFSLFLRNVLINLFLSPLTSAGRLRPSRNHLLDYDGRRLPQPSFKANQPQITPPRLQPQKLRKRDEDA